MKTIEYVAEFELGEKHTFELRRIGGWLWDTLHITIDHATVVDTQIGLITQLRRQVRTLEIDGTPVELSWKWNVWSGDPKYIVLKTSDRLLAAYGQDATLEKLRMLVGTKRTTSEKIAALRLLKESVESEHVTEVGRERFPLDNTYGTDDLTIKQEVSFTVTETISITSKVDLQSRLKGGILTVLEAQVTAQLSKTTGQKLGESMTRKQAIELTVKAGKAVLYTVIWSIKARTGSIAVAIDKDESVVNYEAKYGLSFEIASAPLEPKSA